MLQKDEAICGKDNGTSGEMKLNIYLGEKDRRKDNESYRETEIRTEL